MFITKDPSKADDKAALAATHPGIVKKVYVKSEDAVYTFYKTGDALPAGDRVTATKMSGTWVAAAID